MADYYTDDESRDTYGVVGFDTKHSLDDGDTIAVGDAVYGVSFPDHGRDNLVRLKLVDPYPTHSVLRTEA